MNEVQAIVALEARGLRLSLQEGRLRVEGALDDWSRQVLAEHAPAIAQRLPHRPTPVTAGGSGGTLREQVQQAGEHGALETKARRVFSMGHQEPTCQVVMSRTYAEVHALLRQWAAEAWGHLDQVERCRRLRGALSRACCETGHPWAWRIWWELDWWVALAEPAPAVVG